MVMTAEDAVVGALGDVAPGDEAPDSVAPGDVASDSVAPGDALPAPVPLYY